MTKPSKGELGRFKRVEAVAASGSGTVRLLDEVSSATSRLRVRRVVEPMVRLKRSISLSLGGQRFGVGC